MSSTSLAAAPGKTVFSKKILEFMPGIEHISMDMYNDASVLLEDNFDDPRLTDYATLLDNIQSLKGGKSSGSSNLRF